MKNQSEYRVVEYENGSHNLYVFKKIEFDSQGKIKSIRSVNVGTTSINELKTLLIVLLKAFDKPILKQSDLENAKLL